MCGSITRAKVNVCHLKKVILSQNLTWKLNAAGGTRQQLTIGFPKEAAILLIKTQRIKVIDC